MRIFCFCRRILVMSSCLGRHFVESVSRRGKRQGKASRRWLRLSLLAGISCFSRSRPPRSRNSVWLPDEFQWLRFRLPCASVRVFSANVTRFKNAKASRASNNTLFYYVYIFFSATTKRLLLSIFFYFLFGVGKKYMSRGRFRVLVVDRAYDDLKKQQQQQQLGGLVYTRDRNTTLLYSSVFVMCVRMCAITI